MSLINAMLRDLDERQASHSGSGSEVLQGLRSTPVLKGPRFYTSALRIFVLAVVVLAVLIGIAPGRIESWLVAGARAVIPAPEETSRREPVPVASAPDAPVRSPTPPVVPGPSLLPERAEVERVKPTLQLARWIGLPKPMDTPSLAMTPRMPLAALGDVWPERSTVSEDVAEAYVLGSAAELPLDPVADADNRIDFPTTEPVDANLSVGIIEKTPRTSSAHERAERRYANGAALVQAGRLGDAVRELREALNEEPTHVEARLLLAGCLISQNRARNAFEVLRAGIAILPKQSQFALHYARLLVDEGFIEQAFEVLGGAAPSLSIDPEYHAFKAALLQRMGRHRETVDVYRQVLEHRSDNGVWWMGLAISLEALQELKQAVVAYQRALLSPALALELQQFVGQRIQVLTREQTS